jgi:uncharacterized damage-inducible protein DinB
MDKLTGQFFDYMKLYRSAIDVLNQIKSVLDQLEDEDYHKPLPQLFDASIGQHVRHTLEFFDCLSNKQNVINYDLRKRNYEIETFTQVATEKINELIKFLSNRPVDMPVLFVANFDTTEGEELQISSSFEREIAYNIEHAIHHMALIKIGLQFLNVQIDLPENFGVASSTVRYQQET